MHADLAQALGKMLINLKDLDLDLASFSGHKFYGLKGAGALYRRERRPFGKPSSWRPSRAPPARGNGKFALNSRLCRCGGKKRR